MYLGTGPLQRLDWVAWVTQAQIQRYDWHPDTMRQSEQRDDRVRTLGEGSHLRAKEGGQVATNAANTLVSDFQTSAL